MKKWLTVFGAMVTVVLSSFAQKKVVATTSMIGDIVHQIAGDTAQLTVLMGPGIDPHTYKVSTADIKELDSADLIFYNGLMLEGKMQELFDDLSKKKRVIAVTSAIPEGKLLFPEGAQHHPDPHVWFDPTLWMMTIPVVEKALSELDPLQAALYKANAEKLSAQMRETHQWCLKRVAALEPSKRILITSHDAFNYFGRAYEFIVVGVQGISTATEAGMDDMRRTKDFIQKNHIPVIFVESSVSHSVIESISLGSGARIGGELFSDALGPAGHIETSSDGSAYDVGTWNGMVRHNVETIVTGLSTGTQKGVLQN